MVPGFARFADGGDRVRAVHAHIAMGGARSGAVCWPSCLIA